METFFGFASLNLDHLGFRKMLLACANSRCFSKSSFRREKTQGHELWPLLWPNTFVWLFLLKLSCADFHICTIIQSSHSLALSLFPLVAHTHTHTHAYAHRGKSICVRHSARERQRHWVNYPSFTAAEKSRWQQTICKWQGAVNYSIFLD